MEGRVHINDQHTPARGGGGGPGGGAHEMLRTEHQAAEKITPDAWGHFNEPSTVRVSESWFRVLGRMLEDCA